MPLKGLFINNIKAQDSIYESGRMVYDCLKLSARYDVDYIEVGESQREIPGDYGFYFFNYHPATMHWMDTRKLKKLKKLMITMVLEVAPGNPFVMCPPKHFHGYCVLDPTIKSGNKSVFVFPRPLETINSLPAFTEPEFPVIGSFGFATKGKGFQHVVEAVNKEFDKATIKINISYGDFVPQSQQYASYLGNICKQKAKKGIEVQITHDYMSKEDLIRWCSQNTLNCFLYDRDMPGLSATTDQAIVSERPLAVSSNQTFRHILDYIPSYPAESLRSSILHSKSAVSNMKIEWSAANFAKKFESMLSDLIAVHQFSNTELPDFKLPIKRTGTISFIATYAGKIMSMFTIEGIRKFFFYKKLSKNEELI